MLQALLFSPSSSRPRAVVLVLAGLGVGTWGEMADAPLNENVFYHHGDPLCRGLSFCRPDSDPLVYLCRGRGPCPCPYPCRRCTVICCGWTFVHCAWSATETGAKSGEIVLPVYWRSLENTIYPCGPWL